MSRNIKDITGQKFNRLTVLSLFGRQVSPNGTKKTTWLCRCDCGNETVVTSNALKTNKIKSCGCLKHEKDSERLKTHGKSDTRLYNIWNNIKQRCYNPKGTNYVLYGGRGITMCDEWRNSFEEFYEWSVANGYSDELSIDRIDSNGNYEPGNCRWVTQLVQGNNTRRNVYYEYNGESHTAREWARIVNMNPDTLYERLHYYGWDIEHALYTPVSVGNRWSNVSKVEINHQFDKQS